MWHNEASFDANLIGLIHSLPEARRVVIQEEFHGSIFLWETDVVDEMASIRQKAEPAEESPILKAESREP